VAICEAELKLVKVSSTKQILKYEIFYNDLYYYEKRNSIARSNDLKYFILLF
jgi:hypothetical protein